MQNTAAVEDIKYRLQDFRKKGIGLMLMMHNINDIDPNIRRLCQIKLYLKQASDVAPIACKDLVFTYAEDSEVVSKLKHLNSRTGALNYVVKNGDDKLSQDTIFITSDATTITEANVLPLSSRNSMAYGAPSKRSQQTPNIQQAKIYQSHTSRRRIDFI